MNGATDRGSLSLCSTLKLNLPVLVWLCGLILGGVFSVLAGEFLAPTMHAAASCGMSIPGLFAVLLLPLLISTYAVYSSQPVLLVFLILVKAFLFAYVGAGLLVSYPASGWLVYCLFMFTDILFLPALWWVWIPAVSGSRVQALQRIALCLLWSLMIGCVDITVVAPFLARLI